jgi:hypothetical protein
MSNEMLRTAAFQKKKNIFKGINIRKLYFLDEDTERKKCIYV